MKYLAIIAISLAVMSCKTIPSKEANQVENSNAPSTSLIEEFKQALADPRYNEYEMLFAAIADGNEEYQILAVNQISSDTLECIIVLHSKECADSIKTLAINPFPEADFEIDEDEDGIGYPAIEYWLDQNRLLRSIRVEALEKSKARLRESDENGDKDCKTISNLLLKKYER